MDEALTKATTGKDTAVGMVEPNKETMQFSFLEKSRVEGKNGMKENDKSLPANGSHGPLPFSVLGVELGLRLMDEVDHDCDMDLTMSPEENPLEKLTK